MKLLFKSIISLFFILLLASCGNTINLSYEIVGPNHQHLDGLLVDGNIDELKDEIESNYYLLETTEDVKIDNELIFDYDDFNFGTTGTFDLLISVDSNFNEKVIIETRSVKITLEYDGYEDVYYIVSIFISIENNNINYIELEMLENEVIATYLPSDFPELEELGYIFTHWSYDVGGKIHLQPNDKLTSDINLYTNWEIIFVEEPQKTIDIFYINDLHGQIFHDPDNGVIGISNAYEFIKRYEAQNNTDSLFLFGGDIFQGTLISSHSRGEVMIKILNAVEADGMVLGNHEFDWGIDTITKYFDESAHPVKANFPLLGTNAVNKENYQPIEGLSPFTTVQIGNVTVGIVGVIDRGLETSIMETKVKDYTFLDPLQHTVNQTEILRTNYNADIVIAGLHGGDGVNYNYNNSLSNYQENKLVDVVFNAHRHYKYEGTINRAGNHNLIVMQSGSNGSNLGHIKLYLDNYKNIISHEIRQYRSDDDIFLNSNEEIDLIIDQYYSEISSSYTTALLESINQIPVSNLADYMARISREYTGSDIGLQNSGGTRSVINSGPITHADIYEVFPFDNKVMSVEVLGSRLKTYLNRTSDSISYRDGINGIYDLNDNTYYRVAVNEYTYSSSNNPFISGINLIEHPAQDILVKETFERITDRYFNLNHPNVWINNGSLTNYYNNLYQSNYLSQLV